MVEVSNPGGAGGKEMYWIIDCEDLCWSPGIEVENRKKTIVVKCMITNGHYEIEKEYAINVHPSCLGKNYGFHRFSLRRMVNVLISDNLFRRCG